jgi:cytochrome c biogenesis protein CcmG, thiol:disulfide interchange protein DsbE
MTQSTPEIAPQKKRGVPLWVQVIVWVGLIALLGLVAVGLRRSQQGTVQVGDKAPNFTLTTFSGYDLNGASQVKLSELKGKIVVINFWASWCKPCEQEAAELEQAWRAYQPDGEVVFLGVDYVDTEPEARSYLEKFGITFTNGADLGTRISQVFRIKGVPETYFVDREGQIQYIQVGPFQSLAEIQSVVDSLKAK